MEKKMDILNSEVITEEDEVPEKFKVETTYFKELSGTKNEAKDKKNVYKLIFRALIDKLITDKLIFLEKLKSYNAGFDVCFKKVISLAKKLIKIERNRENKEIKKDYVKFLKKWCSALPLLIIMEKVLELLLNEGDSRRVIPSNREIYRSYIADLYDSVKHAVEKAVEKYNNK